MSSDKLFVAAIDFGTTYSGWGYLSRDGFKRDPTAGYMRQWYSGSGTSISGKTPTVVLIKPDGRTLEAFGYEAENRYMDLVEEDEAGSFYYFRRFKMMLMKKFGEKITCETELEDEMGRRLPAMTVFSLAIEYFVQDAYIEMKKRINMFLPSDVQWVITVPAIWTDQAKKFMRQAAEKAGISSDRLLIALEPECASIYCRYLPLQRMLDKSGVDVSSLPVGSKYMILDAGGGTVDITVHETEQSGALKEIIAASGGGWGGILVDQAFEDMLIDFFGKDVYQKFKTKSTEDWLGMIRTFETKKMYESGRTAIISVPGTLMTLYQEKNKIDLSKSINLSSEYSGNIKLLSNNHKMKFQCSVWEKLHDPAITKTKGHVKELLATKEAEGVKTLIMVGGFSESTLLQEAIKELIGLDVIIPPQTSTAVLCGALIFGFNPGCISKRVLQYTIGCDCVLPFIEGIHPESKRVVKDKGIRCDKCFDKHVEVGQVVKYGEPQTSRFYTPVSRNQKSIKFPLYYSKLKNPKYTDEEGCHFLESFKVELTDPSGDLDRRVYVNLTFSGTEIEAEAKDDKTGIVTKAQFQLPS